MYIIHLYIAYITIILMVVSDMGLILKYNYLLSVIISLSTL